MKYLLLAIFVLIAAQPLQAASCDMHDDQSSGHSQHGDMQHDDAPSMDCCDSDSGDNGDGCTAMSQCGSCPAGLTAVKPSLLNTIFSNSSEQYLADSSAPACRSSVPPFRPPIS